MGGGRTDGAVDTLLGVEPDTDIILRSRGGARVVGRAGGGISTASDFLEAFARGVDKRCALFRLGNAGGMSSSISIASSIASCVSSGVEIVTDTGWPAGEMGDNEVEA